MKSANWISATGSNPFSAAPIATPTIESSASGVSMTRSSPKRLKRPSVALKTPPLTPTSSHSTMIRSSRAISSARVSRIVSTKVFTAIASPPLPRPVPGIRDRGAGGGGACVPIFDLRSLISCIDVQTKGIGGRLRARFGEGDGVVDQCGSALVHLLLGGAVQHPLLLQGTAEELERVPSPCQLDLLGCAVPAVIVVAGMGGEAADVRVDQGRSTTGARSLYCLDGCLVDRDGVRPVDDHARHRIRGSAFGYRGDGHLLRSRDRDCPAVVLADEDDRQMVNAGKVETFVKVTRARAALAKVDRDDSRLVANLHGQR